MTQELLTSQSCRQPFNLSTLIYKEKKNTSLYDSSEESNIQTLNGKF